MPRKPSVSEDRTLGGTSLIMRTRASTASAFFFTDADTPNVPETVRRNRRQLLFRWRCSGGPFADNVSRQGERTDSLAA